MTKPLIAIYGIKSCEACSEAKSYLQENGISFKYVDLDKDDSKIRDLKQNGGKITVPLICSIKEPDRCIKGFSEEAVHKLLSKG